MKNNRVYGKLYLDYQINRGKIRKIVRKWFLNNLLRYVEGKIIDLGCGIGELLKLAEKGSVGYEVNIHAVKYCRDQGLNVWRYNPAEDDYRLKKLKKCVYKTLIMCHVLEHLKKPNEVIRKLIRSCSKLDISRFIIVVPGKRGFESDASHLTYISEEYLKDKNLEEIGEYKISLRSYFPLNFAWAGNLLANNELIVVYERKS